MYDDEQDRYERREDMRRAMEDHEYRNGGRSRGNDDDDDVVEFFVKFFLVIGVVIVGGGLLLYGGADWADNTFGWHLTEWLNSILPEFMHRD